MFKCEMTQANAVIADLCETVDNLKDELTLLKGKAVRLAWIAIGNAETEAELGSVCQDTYDSMLDIYEMFKDNYEIRRDVLNARKAMRQNEWGIDFPVEEFDLPLDADWQD
jgi:hypothetical protein